MIDKVTTTNLDLENEGTSLTNPFAPSYLEYC